MLTSAFSALYHRVPLLVLGDAIFRRSAVTTVGENAQSITRFLTDRKSKNIADIDAFMKAVKSNALLPGDFYAYKSQRATARHVVAKVKGQLQSNETVMKCQQTLEATP